MKTILTNARLLALLLTMAVLATACGGNGGQQGSKSDGNKKEAGEKAPHHASELTASATPFEFEVL